MGSHIIQLFLSAISIISLMLITTSAAFAGMCGDDKLCNLYVNLTGVDPVKAELQKYRTLYEDKVNNGLGSGEAYEEVAKKIAQDTPEFKTITLNIFAQPWAHKDGDLGSPLNDTILTVIKAVEDEIDFRRILYDDIIARAVGTLSGSDNLELPDSTTIKAYYRRANTHYENLQKKEVYYRSDLISLQSQTPSTFETQTPVAGILSTRGFGIAAFLAGTNRRAIPMLLREATCLDMSAIQDSTTTEKYILRDVSRIDGNGGVTTFKNECKTCHAFMDQVAPASIFYDVSGGEVSGNAVSYERPAAVTDSVPVNNKQLKVVEPSGYIPKNDQWRTEFSKSQLELLGWPESMRTGFGLKSLGQAWAHSEAFATCQPKKAFKAVCGSEPTAEDQAFIKSAVEQFKSNGFKLKDIFIKSAVYCSGGYSK